jgi:hypothetical protein
LANLKKSSPLKPLGQMNRNLVGSIYGMSSLKIAYFIPIRYQTLPPQTILVSDWLIYQVSVHLAKRFQRRRFLKIGHSETRIAYYIKTNCFSLETFDYK